MAIRLLKSCQACRGALGVAEFTGEDAQEAVLQMYPEARQVTATLVTATNGAPAPGYSGGFALWAVRLPPPAEHTCPGWAQQRGEPDGRPAESD